MSTLRNQILAAAEAGKLGNTFTYEDIERAVPKQAPFVLAIELCQMQMDKALFFKGPSSYVRNIPVYSLKPFKKTPSFPQRAIPVEVSDGNDT